MNSKEVGIEEARKILGDLVTQVTQTNADIILTRRGRPVARIAPLEAPVSITVTDLAHETGATRDDILALVDQLVDIDGSENVVVSETRYEVTIDAVAAETIREQLATGAPEIAD